MRAVLASLAILPVLAFAAEAQQAMPEMPAPSISETEQAQPDWYQQFTFSDSNVTSLEAPVWQAQPSKTFNLAWVKGERWSLSVDLTSRDENSPLPREEMMAEAEFRITPRISVGGELTIGANELDDTRQWEEQQIEAGIRLRSAFKF